MIENVHHFLNLHNNFQFNTAWHSQSLSAFIFCMRLEENKVTCHAISHVYGLITLVIQAHSLYNFLFNNIGSSY
jgi:hypothetical protein